MGFEIRYGNPFQPGVGDALMEGAREETDFARIQANNRIMIADRNLQLERARLNFQVKQADVDNRIKANAMRLDQEERTRRNAFDERKFNAEQDYRLTTTGLASRQESRLDRDLNFRQKEQQEKEADRNLAETNRLNLAGGRIAKEREKPAAGEIEQFMSNGTRVILPDPVEKQIKIQDQERESKRKWYLDNGYGDPYAKEEKKEKPTLLEVPPEWAPTLWSDASLEGLPDKEKSKQVEWLYKNRLDDDPEVDRKLKSLGFTSKDREQALGSGNQNDARTGELGLLKTHDGRDATEMSITVESERINRGMPTNIPLLVRGQSVDSLLAGAAPTKAQIEIATSRAAERVKNGAYLPFFNTLGEAISWSRTNHGNIPGAKYSDKMAIIDQAKTKVLPLLNPKNEKDIPVVQDAEGAYRALFQQLRDGVSMYQAVKFWDDLLSSRKLNAERFSFPWKELANTIRIRQKNDDEYNKSRDLLLIEARRYGLKVDNDMSIDKLQKLTELAKSSETPEQKRKRVIKELSDMPTGDVSLYW